MSNPLIIGIDPGYDRIGIAVGCKEKSIWRVLLYHCVETDRKAKLFDRYQQIILELKAILDQYPIQEAAIESLFWFKNQSTALHVSEARGVIIAELLSHGITITEYTPLQVKQSVAGYGRADKKAVAKMVQLELNIQEKMIDDTVDALALMICHQSSQKLNKKI